MDLAVDYRILWDKTLKAPALYTSAKSNLGDRILGELEKSSFIALPDRGDTINF